MEEGEARVVMDSLGRELLEPLVDQTQPTFSDHFFAVFRDESRSLPLQPGLQVVVNGLRPLERGLVVRRRVDVKADNLGLGPFGDQATLQEVPEKAVVSVSLLLVS